MSLPGLAPSLAAVLVAVAWCALVGRGLLVLVDALPTDWARRWVLSVVGGMVAGHLLLTGLDAAALPWTRATLLLSGGALLALLGRPLARSLRPGGKPRLDPDPGGESRAAWDGPRFDWADAVAALSVAVCGWASLTLRSPFSDFVYHWGLKAHRFFLAHGTDFEFLARPENVYLHPDYPNLFPQALAAASILAGRFQPAALMIVTPLFLALLLAAARSALRASALAPPVARLVFAGLATALAAFCVGYFQGGSADVPFALAVLLAATALSAADDRRRATVELGVALAFGAALKLEGLGLAAIALALWAARAALDPPDGERWWWRSPAAWAPLCLPPLAVIVAWAVPAFSIPLLPDEAGRLDPSRISAVARNLWRQSVLEEWSGVPLLLLAAPWLALSRSARWIGLLVTAQLAFYLWVYLSSPHEPAFYVLSTWPRLALHLVPATAVGLALALAAPRARRA